MSAVSSGFVYLIHLAGNYKIGASLNPPRRLRAFDNLPWDATLLHWFFSEDYFQVERALHRRFGEKKIKSEWFALAPEDVAAICSVWFCGAVRDLPDSLRP